MAPVERQALEKMVERWRQLSKYALLKGKDRKYSAIEQKFFDHGAICYFICLSDLEEFLSSVPPDTLTSQKALRTTLLKKLHRRALRVGFWLYSKWCYLALRRGNHDQPK
ncbi:MAG: hypothetical protein FWF41_05405 [Betaproteobacteria bacterium]|nr:hypothetical protein [Betaproteobacteria bacterium]